MNDQSTKTPVIFWAISIVGLLWNGFGVVNWARQTFMTEAFLAALPEEQLVLFENVPMWLTAVFAIAVITGTLGCVGLLMKKKWAVPVFLVSLIAIIIQMGYSMTLAEYRDVMGPMFFMFPLVLILVGALLYYYAKRLAGKGFLN